VRTWRSGLHRLVSSSCVCACSIAKDGLHGAPEERSVRELTDRVRSVSQQLTKLSSAHRPLERELRDLNSAQREVRAQLTAMGQERSLEVKRLRSEGATRQEQQAALQQYQGQRAAVEAQLVALQAQQQPRREQIATEKKALLDTCCPVILDALNQLSHDPLLNPSSPESQAIENSLAAGMLKQPRDWFARLRKRQLLRDYCGEDKEDQQEPQVNTSSRTHVRLSSILASTLCITTSRTCYHFLRVMYYCLLWYALYAGQ
jgi:hypothetical protein